MPKLTVMRFARLRLCAIALSAVVAAPGCSAMSNAGANGLLHPARRPLTREQRQSMAEVKLRGEGVMLSAWRLPAVGVRRGSAIYLHGIADNKASGLGAMRWLSARGFDVIAYDSRGHGDSEGDVCTYGFHEKDDLRRVIDALAPGPVLVIGSSLGAAVALQTAAVEPRITAVVAAESFADLKTVATERAPRFFPGGVVRQALATAERQGGFRMDEVSPVESARRIRVPVLIVHGARDRETRPDHARRIFEALQSQKELLLVEGSGHNQSLQSSTWSQIEKWIDAVIPRGIG